MAVQVCSRDAYVITLWHNTNYMMTGATETRAMCRTVGDVHVMPHGAWVKLWRHRIQRLNTQYWIHPDWKLLFSRDVLSYIV